MAYDRRVQLRRSTPTTNAANEDVPTWNDLGPARWADKTDLTDGQRLKAAQNGASITTRWRVRWCAGLADLNAKDVLQELADDRVTVLREYQISGVREIGRKDEWEISSAAKADLITITA